MPWRAVKYSASSGPSAVRSTATAITCQAGSHTRATISVRQPTAANAVRRSRPQ